MRFWSFCTRVWMRSMGRRRWGRGGPRLTRGCCDDFLMEDLDGFCPTFGSGLALVVSLWSELGRSCVPVGTLMANLGLVDLTFFGAESVGGFGWTSDMAWIGLFSIWWIAAWRIK